MRHPTVGRSLLGTTLGLTVLALASCVDAPSAPEGPGALPEPFVIAPVFALAGPDGSVVSGPQASALGDAFDQVDRFRMVVTRVPSGAVALDTIITVTPGQSQYDLSVNVTVNGASEQFSVTLTALMGDIELFKADPITVTAAPSTNTGGGSPPPASADVTLRYSGPGSTATSLVLSPAQAVLAPGGTAQLSAQVLDQGGQPITGVTLAWVSSTPGVASVAAGLATAAGEGTTQITVATPSGLEAKAWVYVVTGELAYVEGGGLKVRAPAGGTAVVRASGGASAPAWTADGGKLYYSAGGQVRLAGGAALASGSWPAPSPDGTKLAVDGVTFINDDGSNPTAGPSGSTPLWLDSENLLVGGGSLQSVRADGTGRTTLVSGSASFPALAGGSLAYISDGALRVQGRTDPLLTGAGGRPSWSPSGAWLVVSAGSGLTLVPSSGEAPPVALPGLGAASDPAFRPSGGLSSPPSPFVQSFEPAAPKPGDVVTLVGSGFDWIIPANTKVFWPVTGGSVEGEVQKVTPTQIQVLMPTAVIAGEVRVTTRGGTNVLAYTPSTSTVQATATTPWGAAVAGVGLLVKSSGGAVLGGGTTNAEGVALIAGIEPGSVNVQITAPAGYVLQGSALRNLILPAGLTPLDLVATPTVQSLKATLDPVAVEVGSAMPVTLVALDAKGQEIPQVGAVTWGGSTEISAAGSGLSGTVTGVVPTAAKAATLDITVDGKTFTVPVSVTSYIRGVVTQDPAPEGAPETAPTSDSGLSAALVGPQPAPNIVVTVMKGDVAVETASTFATGEYVIRGLSAGTYSVLAAPTGDYTVVPASVSVTLGAAQPTGKADFHMSLGVADTVVAAITDPVLESLGAMTTFTFQAFDSLDVLLLGRPATYESSEPGAATVDSNGKVTAVNNGSSWIRVTVDGVKDSVLVTVDQKAVALQLFKDVGEPAPDSARFLVQEEFQILYEAKDANGNLIPSSHRKPTYSPDTGKLAIDADGNAVASAFDVGREVLIVNMDAASDTLIVWVLGVRVGDFDVNYDMAVMADSLYGQIQGTLWVDASGLTDLDGLWTIGDVWGDVNVRDNSSLVDISGLRNIEDIGGTLRIKRNPVLTTPAVPPAALRQIGGNLKIWDNPLITNADAFGNLESVDGYIDIMGNPALATVGGFASLQMAGGLALEGNQVLTVPSGFPALEWLGWDGLYIDEGATVARFPSLKGVEGEITVGGEASPVNPIESLDFPSLQCVQAGIWLYDNESLAQAKFPALDHVGSCDTPFDVDAAPPAPVSGAFRTPSANRVIPTLLHDPDERDPRSLESRRARQKTLSQSTRDEVRRRSAEADAQRDAARSQSRTERNARRGPEKLARAPRPRPQQFSEPARTSEYGSSLTVEYNPVLAQLDLGALRHVEGDLSLADNDFGTLTIPLLETIGTDLSIYGSGLVTLSLPELLSVSDDVWIEYTTEFERLLAPKLESVGDDVYVDYNDALGDFVLESLKSIGYTIEFYSNTWDGVLRLPKLEDVYSDFSVEYNTGLTSVEVATESLLAVGYYFEVGDNDGLESITVPGADYLYYFSVGYNPDLASISVATSATLEVGYDFDIYQNDLLQTINMPGLASAYYVDIENNDNLTAVDLATAVDLTIEWRLYVRNNAVPHAWTLNVPRLVQVTSGYVQIEDNDGLQTFDASALTTVGDYVKLYANPALTSLSLGSLSAIGGWLYVEQTGLANLGAFAGLTSALTSLAIINNPALTDVTGLNGIGSAAGADPVISGYLNIQDNAALCDTDAAALHSVLEAKFPVTTAVGGSVVILNNKPCG